jgi:hypothetical protein
MKRSARSSLAVILLLITASGCGGGDASTDAGHDACSCGDGGGDRIPPDPGTTLTASNPTSSTVDLSWSAATDDTTAAASLEYRVYFSLTDNLDALGDVENNGTAAGDWQANLTALTVDSLSLDTTYYFNVLVRDEAGNMAVYGGASETTLDGSWQDAAPLEDYTGGSIYYSTLALGPDGEVLAYWDQQPAWDAHFATRGLGLGAFSGAAQWNDEEAYTPTIDYGFDGNLMGASLRSNGDDTSDVLFGAAVPGSGIMFDEVATGLVTDYAREALACVAQNGDVMVVWMDGTADSTYSLRARFRTGTTWGTTSLVSAGEGLNLYGLDVVCSPNGNHMVLFGEDDGSARALNARVYDAALDSWMAEVPLGEDSYQYYVETARTADGRVVVAYEEYDDTEMRGYFRARTYNGTTWSTPADTLASDDPVDVNNLRLAAAGNDVHAVWRASPSQFMTRRLEAGTTTWTAEAPLETVAAVQEFCLAGGPTGGLVLAWAASSTVAAQLYSPGTETWGTSTPLLPAGDGVGYGSLACVMDQRRNATVVWTEWDPIAGEYSAFERMFR